MRFRQERHRVPNPFQLPAAVQDVLGRLDRGHGCDRAAGHPFQRPSLPGLRPPAGSLQIHGDPIEPRPDSAACRVVASAIPEGDHEDVSGELVGRLPPGVAGEERPNGGVVPVEDDSEALRMDQGRGNCVCIVVRPHAQYFAAGAREFQVAGVWPKSPPGSVSCESVGLVHPQDLFDRDEYGRTVLFAAAEQGRQEEVSRIIFSLAGTGLAAQRLALIAIEDHEGLTAADVAEQGGHRAIADLLRGERARMEFFE